jgi:hypothetical protein
MPPTIIARGFAFAGMHTSAHLNVELPNGDRNGKPAGVAQAHDGMPAFMALSWPKE